MIEIIPAIDIIDGKCVRLSQGDYNRCVEYGESPVDMAKMFEDCGVGRLHVVDLEGAKGESPKNLESIEKIASHTSLKIEMGGGIKSNSSLTDAFNAGVERVVCGSIACSNRELFCQWLKKYSGDKVVLGADIKDGKVAVKGWTQSENISLDTLFAEFLKEGLKYAIVTEIERDGMLGGASSLFYKELIEKYPTLHIIASGGIGNINDIIALQDVNVESVIVGKALYEGRITLNELKEFILNRL